MVIKSHFINVLKNWFYLRNNLGMLNQTSLQSPYFELAGFFKKRIHHNLYSFPSLLIRPCSWQSLAVRILNCIYLVNYKLCLVSRENSFITVIQSSVCLYIYDTRTLTLCGCYVRPNCPTVQNTLLVVVVVLVNWFSLSPRWPWSRWWAFWTYIGIR